MKYQSLDIVISDQVATVHLNRPAVRNAFDANMIAEITEAFQQLGQNETVRAIVLAARGSVFSAGADLNWMKQMAGFSHEENLADAHRLAAMLRTIYVCPKPVVAKVQGDCFGGGVGLVAACDIAIAAADVNFSLAEVKLGLIPATISPYVIRAMGKNAARRYFLTGELFSSQEAYRLGFVHEVAQAGVLDVKVNNIVKALVFAGPHAVKEAKRLVRDVAGAPLSDELIAETAKRIADIRSSDEGREGVAAFLEKRKPGWLG